MFQPPILPTDIIRHVGMHACRDTRIALRSLSRQCNAVVSSLVFDDVTFHATEASLARSKSCSHLLGYVNFLRILIDASSEPAADIVTTMLCTLTQARHLQSVTLVLLVHEEESSIASIRSARTFGFIVRHALDQRLPYTICAITSKDDGETLRIHVSTTPEVPRDMLYSITLSRSKYVCSISPWIWYADLHNLVTELAVDNAVLDVISITGLAAVFPNIRHLSLTHSSFIIKLDSFVITWNSLWLVFDRLWTLRSKSTSDCGYVEQASQQGYEEVAIDRILEANKAEYDMNPRGPLKLLASFIEAFANIVREMAQSLASMPDSSGVIYLDLHRRGQMHDFVGFLGGDDYARVSSTSEDEEDEDSEEEDNEDDNEDDNEKDNEDDNEKEEEEEEEEEEGVQ